MRIYGVLLSVMHVSMLPTSTREWRSVRPLFGVRLDLCLVSEAIQLAIGAANATQKWFLGCLQVWRQVQGLSLRFSMRAEVTSALARSIVMAIGVPTTQVLAKVEL